MKHRHHMIAVQSQEVKVLFGSVLVICLIISTATMLGLNLGTGAVIYRFLPDHTGQAFSLSYVNTLLHWACIGVSTVVVILGFVQYMVQRDISVLAVACILGMAAVFEFLHIIVSDTNLLVQSPENLVKLTWVLTRLCKMALAWLVLLYLINHLDDRVEVPIKRAGAVLLTGIAGCALFGVCAIILLGSGLVADGSSNLKGVTGRPLDFFALLGFVTLGVYLYPLTYMRYKNRLILFLMLSAVPEIFSQLHACFGAGPYFDSNYHTAALFKLMAYALPLAGLLADYYRSYQDEAEAVAKFRSSELRLKSRLLELQDTSIQSEMDAAERQSAENAIRVLDRAIAASSCGIIITDPKVPGNQIIYVNPSFERITGYPAEEAIGHRLDFLYSQDPDQPAVLEVAEAIAEARESRVVMRNYDREGNMFWSDLDIAPIPDEDGMLSHYIGIMTDITDRVRAEEEHKKFTAKLELTNRELEDFVHVASHDLQEPLRKLQVFGDRLTAKCNDTIPEEGRLYLERMQNSVRRMDQLIKDLLVYSRIGRKEQQLKQVNLNQVAEDVLSDLEVRIEETQGTVEVGPLPELEADETQMRQILQNLIGNALKFHRPGHPPVVKVTSQQAMIPIDGQPAPHYQITVQDNGIGFDEKYIERIFTVFQRLHTGSTYEGTGLGLTVCRKICERHGGRISAHSAPGQGATFVVTLPASRRYL